VLHLSAEDTNPKLEPAKIGPAYCRESRELLDAFGEAVQELVLLHEQQFQATVSGDPDSDRFDLLIHMVNEKKYEAKYMYLRHLEIHGCCTGYDTE
jgi:hypothetical protein